MRTISFTSILILLISTSVTGQLRYITVDSLSFIKSGQEVKLDFKTRNGDWYYPPAYPSLRGSRYIQNKAWVGDTVNINIDSRQIQLIERKGKIIDWYLFEVERLESNNFKQGHTLVIPKSEIRDIKSDSVLFQLTMDLYKDTKNKKWKKVDTWTKDIWIKKENLDGVLIHINTGWEE